MGIGGELWGLGRQSLWARTHRCCLGYPEYVQDDARITIRGEHGEGARECGKVSAGHRRGGGKGLAGEEEKREKG
jgi:hypothetical protein